MTFFSDRGALRLRLFGRSLIFWFVGGAGDFSVIDLESLVLHHFFRVLFIFEDNEPEPSRFFALPVLDNVGYLGRSDLGLEKLLKFGTIDIGRKSADEKLALLQLFGVLGQAVLLQFGFAFDHAVLEHVVLE